MIPQTEHRLITSRLSRKSILFTLSLSLIFTSIGAVAQTDKDLLQLEAGKPIERELKAGEIHSYQITFSANQFMRMVVNQRRIDVVVILFGPDGKQITEVDSPNGTQGPEPVSFITPVGGQYRLDVRSLEKGGACWTIRSEDRRDSTGHITRQYANSCGEDVRAGTEIEIPGHGKIIRRITDVTAYK